MDAPLAVPDFGIVDAHTHLFHPRGGLDRFLTERDLRVLIINITGHSIFHEPMEARWEAMVRMKETWPDRVFLCTTFETKGVNEADFTARTIETLQSHIDQGATVVKVWKDIGLEVRDPGGHHVQIDDERFRPIWDFLAGRGIPVIAHIAEPKACWQPLDRKSPHYLYYQQNPQYHAYLHPEMPQWEYVIAARDRWIEANPGLTIVGAHFGSNEHDVCEVAERLRRFPNYHVDTAERFDDLFIQPHDAVREFFLEHAHRVIYGTDVIFDDRPEDMSDEDQDRQLERYGSLLNAHLKYLAGSVVTTVHDKTVDPIDVQGLGLPDAVLRAVLRDNAFRILGVTD
jgi:predicted TIM-barrel fold metal-dependent hydrolase